MKGETELCTERTARVARAGLKLRLDQQQVRAVGADRDLDLVLALERDAVAACQGRLGDIGLAFEHEGIEAVRLDGR